MLITAINQTIPTTFCICSTFYIIKDGVALHHEEIPHEIYRMVWTRLGGNVYWNQLKYVNNHKDKRFIEIFDPVLRGGNFPLVVWQPSFSSNRAKFETWQPILNSQNLQIFLFTNQNDLLEGEKVTHWVNHIRHNIGLLCLLLQNGSPNCTTVHSGENTFSDSGWLDQALGCGQAYYQSNERKES